MYNFKKETSVYLVRGSDKYKLEVYADLSASQTFDEGDHEVRTLHAPTDFHKRATITKANPGNFSFTSPLKLEQSDTPYSVLLDLALSYSVGTLESVDLYIVSSNVTYRLQKAIFDNVTFNLNMGSVITISVSGSCSIFSKFTGTIPGTLVNSVTSNYTAIRKLLVQIDNTTLTSIAAISIDVANDTSWRENRSIHTLGTIVYPENYILSGRRISGSVTQFLTTDNVDVLNETSTTSDLEIAIYNDQSDTEPFLTFLLPQIVYTRRVSFDDIVNRVYDFRLTSNAETTKALEYYTTVQRS